MIRGLAVPCLLLTAACADAGTAPIQVLAASSLTEVMTELRDEFEAETGMEIELTFGSSSSLALQIANGAPVDVFVSASVEWADEVQRTLTSSGVVQHRGEWASNRLVLVSGPGRSAVTSMSELVGEGDLEIAVAETGAVPAGIYAREALQSLGLWDALAGRLVPGDNVRTALGWVETGAVPYGIVYRTDALASDGVEVQFEFDPSLHSPIRYSSLLVLRDGGTPGAADFNNRFMWSDPGARVLEAHGFEPLLDAGVRAEGG